MTRREGKDGSAGGGREARLAAALRANLRRRKAQARGRADRAAPESEKAPAPGDEKRPAQGAHPAGGPAGARRR